MKVIKKYTALRMSHIFDNDEEKYVTLSHGEFTGPYYSRHHPTEEFDTEEEAIKYAYKEDKYAKWLILPIVKFNNFDEW